VEFGWDEQDAAFRAEVVAFLERELPDNWWNDFAYDGPAGPELMAYAPVFNAKLAEQNLVVRHWPHAYGGQATSAWQHIILSEEMWSRGEPRSSLYLGTNWAGPAIMQFGTEPQKQQYLLPIAQGKLLWCQGFSEPEAGTDLANMATRAEHLPEGGYKINGSKVWTSYAARADICFLLAKLDGGSKQSVTCFILPMDTPGLEVRPIPALHSPHDFCEMFLTDVVVSEDSRLGEEGKGWDVVTTIIAYERIGAARYEFSRRTLDHIVVLLKKRGLFDDPGVRAQCANALALVEAGRLLVYLVIDGREKDNPPGADTFVARHAMIQADHAVANITSTYLRDLLAQHGDGMLRAHFTAAITSGIAAGAAEVQLNMISGRYLNLPRAA